MRILLISTFAVALPTSVIAFSISPPSHTSTCLFGRKRGKLAQNVTPGGLKTVGRSKTTAKTSGKVEGGDGAGISRSLADWATSDEPDAGSSGPAVPAVVKPAGAELEGDAAAIFVQFPDSPGTGNEEKEVPVRTKGRNRKGQGKDKNSADRRSRQSERRAQELARMSLTRSTITDLEEMLNPADKESKKSKTRNMDAILGKIRSLIENNEGNMGSGLKVLSQDQAFKDYRMAWAGSDESICHLGTGLHKVPLARLEEVFLTLGRNRVEITEIIRIIGPFPNIRNTLKGNISLVKTGGSDAATGFNIAYDSMVDGLGKEIMAGTDDNVRRVVLDVLYADEEAIVCAMPAEKVEEAGNPFADNGARVLLFVKEVDLSGKLAINRVS